MKAIIVLLVMVVLVNAKLNVKYPHEWHAWKSEHGKSYDDEHEELRRHIVWLANGKYIEEHNKYSDEFGFTLKMNHFGDLVSLSKPICSFCQKKKLSFLMTVQTIFSYI